MACWDQPTGPELPEGDESLFKQHNTTQSDLKGLQVKTRGEIW